MASLTMKAAEGRAAAADAVLRLKAQMDAAFGANVSRLEQVGKELLRIDAAARKQMEDFARALTINARQQAEQVAQQLADLAQGMLRGRRR